MLVSEFWTLRGEEKNAKVECILGVRDLPNVCKCVKFLFFYLPVKELIKLAFGSFSVFLPWLHEAEAMSTRDGILVGAHRSAALCVSGENMMRQTQEQQKRGAVFPAERKPQSHCPFNLADFKQHSSLCYLLLGTLILLMHWHWIDVGEISSK